MKSTGTRSVTRILFVSLLLAATGAGCAQTAPESLSPGIGFTRAQIDNIMFRRDQGDALAEIARTIGSTRPEVRQAERQEKARLRGEVRQ